MLGKWSEFIAAAAEEKEPMSRPGISLKERLSLPASSRPFLLLCELPPVSGDHGACVESFLRELNDRASECPPGTALSGVTLPQNPRGVASLDPAGVFAAFDREGLWSGFDVVPHLSAKDAGVEGLKSGLLGLRTLGLQSVLAVTGDVPQSGAGVFEVDSLGLLDLVREMNFESWQRAPLGRFEDVHQFFPLAAVSPFKYTEPSQMQQYLKMKKKIRAGAEALITQMGWDSAKSEELFRYLRDEEISVPVFGNVFLLSTITPAARLMREGKMPGCLVTEDLFGRVGSEPFEAHLERAAQQTAMYRDLGAAGVDFGGFPDFGSVLAVLKRADEIGADWRRFRENLDFGARGLPDGSPAFYLYDEDGARRVPGRPKPAAGKRGFDLLHRTLLTPGRGAHGPIKAIFGRSSSLRAGRGPLYKLVLAGEKALKSVLFDCDACGDCFLVENFGSCTVGGCHKGLPNPPCGDAAPDGTCGNDRDRICVGESIYRAAASEGVEGLRRLAGTFNPPRLSSLQGTSSVLNYLFEEDHTRKSGLILVGENVHATIPRTHAAMQTLLDRGPAAFEVPGGALDYLTALVEAQVRHRADFIDVNVDAFGDGDMSLRMKMMRDYVRLVRRSGGGVPVCVDSDSPEVLEAGLEEWYREAPAGIAAPLLNSVKIRTMDRVLPLRRRHPFKFIGLLVDDHASNWAEVCGSEEQHALATRLFGEATERHGFSPDEIYFDATVFPLAVDMPMVAGRPGYTHRTFRTIRKIKDDSALRGVHLVLGVSNAVRDLPGRRTGVCRAYLAEARTYGLDAAIVNVLHDYGLRPPAPDLVDFVRAFATQDGSPEAGQKVVETMRAFCRANRPAGRRKN
jgi:methylenetetrahydrofolate reductase (NADPH)